MPEIKPESDVMQWHRPAEYNVSVDLIQRVQEIISDVWDSLPPNPRGRETVFSEEFIASVGITRAAREITLSALHGEATTEEALTAARYLASLVDDNSFDERVMVPLETMDRLTPGTYLLFQPKHTLDHLTVDRDTPESYVGYDQPTWEKETTVGRVVPGRDGRAPVVPMIDFVYPADGKCRIDVVLNVGLELGNGTESQAVVGSYGEEELPIIGDASVIRKELRGRLKDSLRSSIFEIQSLADGFRLIGEMPAALRLEKIAHENAVRQLCAAIETGGERPEGPQYLLLHNSELMQRMYDKHALHYVASCSLVSTEAEHEKDLNFFRTYREANVRLARRQGTGESDLSVPEENVNMSLAFLERGRQLYREWEAQVKAAWKAAQRQLDVSEEN